MTATRNIEIFKDTLNQIEYRYPIDMGNVKYYNGVKMLPTLDSVDGDSEIVMVRGGTVSTGYANADKMRTAILNFADALEAGGLVWVGANTQEENICRCSNLYPMLDNKKSRVNYYTPNAKMVELSGREVYTDRIIYARDVIVFKDDKTYLNIKPRKLDVITCPAPNTPLKELSAMKIYATRMEQIILSAIDNGVECLVLGAWGCGAFGQTPELVANSFAQVLNVYRGYFKKVVFAIRPTYSETDGMYEIFDKVLTNNFGEVKHEK